jgi:hypothetical protein
MLPLTGIPPFLKPHLEFFRRCFERHDTYDHFAEYVTGLIAGTNTTVAGIARLFVNGRDPSTKTRFLSESPWSLDYVMNRAVALLKEHAWFSNPNRGFLVIDDTDCEHDSESGKTESGMDSLTWQCGPDGHYVFCHPVVTSHWVTPHGHYPIGFRIRMPSGVGKNKLAYWLINRALKLELVFKTVVFDAWYLCPLLTQFCEENGLEWVSRLKSNRVGFIGGKKVNIMQWFESLPASGRHRVDVDGQKILCAAKAPRLSSKEKVRVVAAYELGRAKETVLIVTSALGWNPENILRAYGHRWRIETFYRDAKQNLGLESYLVRDIRAVERHIALVFVAFTILQLCSRDRRFKDLVAGAVSIGAQIRKVTTEAVGMFIVWVSKQVHAGETPESILDFTFRSKAEVAAM